MMAHKFDMVRSFFLVKTMFLPISQLHLYQNLGMVHPSDMGH